MYIYMTSNVRLMIFTIYATCNTYSMYNYIIYDVVLDVGINVIDKYWLYSLLYVNYFKIFLYINYLNLQS